MQQLNAKNVFIQTHNISFIAVLIYFLTKNEINFLVLHKKQERIPKKCNNFRKNKHVYTLKKYFRQIKGFDCQIFQIKYREKNMMGFAMLKIYRMRKKFEDFPN